MSLLFVLNINLGLLQYHYIIFKISLYFFYFKGFYFRILKIIKGEGQPKHVWVWMSRFMQLYIKIEKLKCLDIGCI